MFHDGLIRALQRILSEADAFAPVPVLAQIRDKLLGDGGYMKGSTQKGRAVEHGRCSSEAVRL